MGATTCPACGAPVIVAQLAATEDDPEPGRVVLDNHAAASGPGRYAIWDDGRARPVAAAAEVSAHPFHQCIPPLRS